MPAACRREFHVGSLRTAAPHHHRRDLPFDPVIVAKPAVKSFCIATSSALCGVACMGAQPAFRTLNFVKPDAQAYDQGRLFRVVTYLTCPVPLKKGEAPRF
jgi:hypothetical protein